MTFGTSKMRGMKCFARCLHTFLEWRRFPESNWNSTDNLGRLTAVFEEGGPPDACFHRGRSSADQRQRFNRQYSRTVKENQKMNGEFLDRVAPKFTVGTWDTLTAAQQRIFITYVRANFGGEVGADPGALPTPLERFATSTISNTAA
jgi:hypothetical protein